jgi:uncharacterized 2Fe-2S/4Fe-4S cluster protein (DUF4445 family)
MPETFAVEFEPMGARADVAEGSTVMDAARAAGIAISSTCGGEGTCGRCRVVVLDGAASAPTDADLRYISQIEAGAGQRLACRTAVTRPLRVQVPKASLIAGQRLQLDGPARKIALEAAVHAHEIEADPPNLEDPRSDVDRVAAALSTAHGLNRLATDPAVVRQLAPLARRTNWQLTAYVRNRDIIGFAALGRGPVGLAVDLGTTKVAGYLIDLVSGESLAAEGIGNPQISYGEDVIARLAYAARHDHGAEQLATVVRAGIDRLLGQLTETAGVSREQVVDATIVGNTAMHHLLIGLPTKQLSQAPFVPAASAPMDIRARDLGIEMAPDARVHIPPVIGGFVGADTVAMVIGADLDRLEKVAVGVDIGTNTEIVLRRPGLGHLASASCASGPAFEGAHIRDGMRGQAGAIEGVRLSADGAAPELRVIGDQAPAGICGSGIVDAIAELWRTDRIDMRGRFRRDAAGVREGDKGAEYVLAGAAVTGIGRDIAITQNDVNEIQLAKGAIAAGISILLEATGTPPEDVDEVIVAGAFGTYLDLDSALAIGLLPRLPRAEYSQIGNAAGTGARAALLSLRERERARRIAHGTRYLELTSNPGFHRRFARSMLFNDTVTKGS